jgi:hypothetical protein
MNSLFYKWSLAVCIILVVVVNGSGWAQVSDCGQVLSKAQDLYKEGRISEIAELLEPCLQEGFTKQEKVEAYRLLSLSNLYFNERGRAEKTMTLLLKNGPEYKLKPTDPNEFVLLYNSFRTTPYLLIGGKFGINLSDIDVIKNFSYENSQVNIGEYSTKVGLQGGILFQIPVYKRFSLLTEILYVQKRFLYKDRLFNYSSIELPESQTYFEIPVLVNYNFGREKWVPYVNAGVSFSYLTNSYMSPLRKDSLYVGGGREVKEGEIDVTRLRQRVNYNLIIGAGLKVKNVIGRGYIFLDVRYCHGLNKLNDPAKRYSNEDLMYKYFYTDSDFRLNSFQYSLGYLYPLYKPKLKRKVKEK